MIHILTEDQIIKSYIIIQKLFKQQGSYHAALSETLCGKTGDDGEDVVQNTIVKLLELNKQGKIDDIDNLVSWISTFSKHHLLDLVKKASADKREDRCLRESYDDQFNYND